jgi:hypothetical protein
MKEKKSAHSLPRVRFLSFTSSSPPLPRETCTAAAAPPARDPPPTLPPDPFFFASAQLHASSPVGIVRLSDRPTLPRPDWPLLPRDLAGPGGARLGLRAPWRGGASSPRFEPRSSLVSRALVAVRLCDSVFRASISELGKIRYCVVSDFEGCHRRAHLVVSVFAAVEPNSTDS